MSVEALIEMDDEEFRRKADRAVKNRHRHPEWWKMFLHPDVIDATEQVIQDAIEVASGHTDNPRAKTFVRAMRDALDEIDLSRLSARA